MCLTTGVFLTRFQPSRVSKFLETEASLKRAQKPCSDCSFWHFLASGAPRALLGQISQNGSQSENLKKYAFGAHCAFCTHLVQNNIFCAHYAFGAHHTFCAKCSHLVHIVSFVYILCKMFAFGVNDAFCAYFAQHVCILYTFCTKNYVLCT